MRLRHVRTVGIRLSVESARIAAAWGIAAVLARRSTGRNTHYNVHANSLLLDGSRTLALLLFLIRVSAAVELRIHSLRAGVQTAAMSNIAAPCVNRNIGGRINSAASY